MQPYVDLSPSYDAVIAAIPQISVSGTHGHWSKLIDQSFDWWKEDTQDERKTLWRE